MNISNLKDVLLKQIGLTKIPADVNARDEDWLDQTPLHDAHHPREVRRLLDAGADIEARDGLGNTPLHSVTSEGAVIELIKAGADINAQNNQGETPLFNARGQGMPGR